ncbi:hypothetical protein Tco_0593216 [Tanacetum coccineum]
MSYNEKTEVYSCQVDEQWFDLSADLLRKALAITPVNPAQPFELPPSGNTVIDFVNELGYPKPVEIVSNIRCEWEEFTQGIQTFFSHKASHKASLKNPKKKVTPLLIPYGRFSKVIIYFLASNNNIHRHPESAVHHTGDDFILGNLKFVPKGESVKVFGMAFRIPLITEAIQQSFFYPKYLEMVAENKQRKTPSRKCKRDLQQSLYTKMHTTTTPVKQSKPDSSSDKRKPSKALASTESLKGNATIQLVDEDDEAQQEFIPSEEGNDPDLKLAKKLSLEAHQEKGEEEGNDADLERAIKLSLDPAFLPQGRAPVWRQIESETEALLSKGGQRFMMSRHVYSNIRIREESDSHHTGSSHQTIIVTSSSDCSFTDVYLLSCYTTGQSSTINTEATTITTSLPEITPFIALQLRVARLEQEMSEVKKTDHSTDVLASIRSQVPTAVDKYLGSKLDDALLKVLERHTADLIEKYSVLPGPESIQNQESEKSPKEIIRAKKEQGEEKQDSTYSIRSTDKVDLEEFDLKSALFNHMNKKKSANRNTANYHLYHALMEALIADEDAMDKELKILRKMMGSQSSKKPRESEASASKQHALTSTGWQITDTRDDVVNSSMPRSDTESEHSEQSSDDIPMQDEGHVSDLEDTDNAHIPKVSTTTWFKPIPEGERPATPEPEWTIPPNDFPEPENNWANTYATTYQVPAENKLQRKTYDIGSFIKWFCRRTGKKKLCKADLEGPAFNLVKAFHKNNVFLQYQMDECHKLLTNKVDLGNPEGHQILRNIYEPLPLGGPPGQVTIQPQFFFNKDLDYLLTGDKERKIALSISKLKAARYLDFGLEELVPSLWVESERDYDISAAYGITHWWFRRKEFYINKHSEPSDREAVRSQMRILSVISVKVFEKYGYNYLREIILRRADYQEYKISEKDFKNLHPNDFEDLNHVGDLQLRIESYQTKINLERPNWDAADYYFKEDYTIVPKPRAVVYRDRNDQRKLMRLNELHKFSDGTLTRVMEKLDHMVKDFHLYEYNKGMETRKWSEDDKTAIEKRLQTRRIFRSLESFVGGRIRDIDYRLINRTT